MSMLGLDHMVQSVDMQYTFNSEVLGMKMNFRHKLEFFCLITPFFFLFLPVHSTFADVPSSFYVEFEGSLQMESDVFLVVFTNGSETSLKNLTITLSMDKIDSNKFNVHLAVDTEVFFREHHCIGEIVDNRLLTNSTSSLFMIDPKMLDEGANILIEKTPTGKILGDVRRLGKTDTSIPNHQIQVRMVAAYHVINSEKQRALNLCFDSNTGLLVRAAGILSDVLLYQMEIDSIWGGFYDLSSFSETLDFVLIETNSSTDSELIFIFLFILSALFGLLVITIYRVNKKKKRN